MREIDIDSEVRRRAWAKQLIREFEDICYQHSLKIIPAIIEISSSKCQLGSWEPFYNKISISEHLIVNYDWSVVIEVLKHEMAHQIVYEVYSDRDENHGPLFNKVCEQLGVEKWARKAQIDTEGILSYWKSDQMSAQEEVLCRRAEKLLALAESSNEHEALLAMEKVRELYSKHHLEQISKLSPDDHVCLIINHKRRKIYSYQSKICQILSKHFFVKLIYTSLYDSQLMVSHKVVELMGTRENVLMSEYVYWFLYNNLNSLWNERKKSLKGSSGLVKKKNSYFLGVLTGFDKKLSENKKKSAITTEKDPNIHDNQLLVIGQGYLDQYAKKRYPKTQSRCWGATSGDSNSFYAGMGDGQKLNLHRGIHSRSTGKAKLLRASLQY
ncbi:MAG: DUF2786 domain-containing protein [Bdellovibrionota bacterium]